MPTREDIEALKANWLDDPCYDIDAVPGFEEHADELREFAQRKEAEWTAKRLIRLQERSERLGCAANIKLANYVERLEAKIASLEKRLDEIQFPGRED